MYKISTIFTLLIIVSIGFLSQTYAQDEWVMYKTDDYGFSMLVPKGTQFIEKEFEGGWGALYAEFEGVELWAVGKLGTSEKPKTIEQYGVKITKTPENYWKTIDQGKEQSGWKWYYTVKAVQDNTVVYGGYGVGSKGSYLLVLKTTVSDFEANKKDYQKWYHSIILY